MVVTTQLPEVGFYLGQISQGTLLSTVVARQGDVCSITFFRGI